MITERKDPINLKVRQYKLSSMRSKESEGVKIPKRIFEASSFRPTFPL